MGFQKLSSYQLMKWKVTSHARSLSRQIIAFVIVAQLISFSDSFLMMIKLSAKYSVNDLRYNINSSSFYSDSVPLSLFVNLSSNFTMTMRLNSSKSHRFKAFLKVSSMCHFDRWLMTLSLYESGALWTYRRLHWHVALFNYKRMIIKTDISMTRIDKLLRHCRVYLSFLLIIDRCIKRRVL